MKNTLILSVLAAMAFSSCGLNKDVDIDLPDFNPGLIVESYLVPGEPYRLLLTQSKSYFDPLPVDDPLAFYQSILVNDAEVMIVHGSDTIHLRQQLDIDIPNRKLYNYFSDSIVPQDFQSEFRLLIKSPGGGQITATTYIPIRIPIDSILVQFSKEHPDKARTLVFTTDNPDTKDYYRRIIHHLSLDSIPMQDYVTDDALFSTPKQLYGTGYDFEIGDTVYNTQFHLTKEHFLFINSFKNSGSNPFTQPGIIQSNVIGTVPAMGIFTGLTYFRDTTVISK